MSAQKYDTLIIGQPSQDINTDFDGTTIKAYGGAVIYSGFAASALGHKTAVLPKSDLSQYDARVMFADAPNVTVYPCKSAKGTSISNVYHTADRERRTCRAISLIDPYTQSDMPEDVDARIWHLAGLMVGDIPGELIEFAAHKASVAVDVQCLLRKAEEDGSMKFYDWEDKLKYLPMIDFLKTDAAEAEILTGMSDRKAAAKQLFDWGAREIMITHNTEVLIFDGEDYFTRPIKSRNLSGRTGRGDTTFAGYINERLYNDIPTSLLYATALVSLKMETPGPFKGTRDDVEDYIEKFYK